jgi:hypothetical protein
MIDHQYVEPFTLPGRAYDYQVDGVGRSGLVVISQSVRGNPISALPAQLTILLTSLLFGSMVLIGLQASRIVYIIRNRGMTIWRQIVDNCSSMLDW